MSIASPFFILSQVFFDIVFQLLESFRILSCTRSYSEINSFRSGIFCLVASFGYGGEFCTGPISTLEVCHFPDA
jgi:hypothetical protein